MGSICERTEVNNAIIEIHHDKIKQKEIQVSRAHTL